MEQIVHDSVDQGSDPEWRIARKFGIKDDGSGIGIVLAQQTAGTFAGATASSTAAAACRLLGNDTDSKFGGVVRQVLAHEPNDLVWCAVRPEPLRHCLSVHHGQTQTIKTDAFGNLLKVKFNPSLLGVGQVWFGFEEHD
jgi:hypothetical protein